MKQNTTIKFGSQIANFIVLGVFAAIAGITIVNHDMWRDEWQSILLSYKSNSLIDLWKASKDEGSPILWFVLLYITKFIGSSIVIPKILQYLGAVSYCGIILFYAPFPRIARYTLVFTYFLLFEYAVIIRDYGISILLIFSLMALWKTRHKHKWIFALVLFLLTQSIFYGTMMADVFVFILLAEPLLLNNKLKFNSKDLPFIITGIIGVIVSFITILRCEYYPDKLVHFSSNYLKFELVLDNIYQAFIPMPKLTPTGCWNSIIIDNTVLRVFISVVIIAGIIYFFRSDKRSLVFFFAYLILHEFFSYFYFIGQMRHNGYLFIAAIVAFWFYYFSNPKPVFKLFQKTIIGAVVLLQIVAALYLVKQSLAEPFSEATEAAFWLSDNHLNHLPIYGHYTYCSTGIAGYLDKQIIDVNTLKPYYATPWSEISVPGTDSMLQTHFQQILAAQDSAILVLCYNSPFIFQNLNQGNPHVIPLKLFNNSMSGENFIVLLLKK